MPTLATHTHTRHTLRQSSAIFIQRCAVLRRRQENTERFMRADDFRGQNILQNTSTNRHMTIWRPTLLVLRITAADESIWVVQNRAPHCVASHKLCVRLLQSTAFPFPIIRAAVHRTRYDRMTLSSRTQIWFKQRLEIYKFIALKCNEGRMES